MKKLITTALATLVAVYGYSQTNVESSYSSSTTMGNAFPRVGAVNTNPSQGNYNVSEIYATAGNGAVSGGMVATYSSSPSSWAPAFKIRTTTNHPIIFETNGTERMRLQNSGEAVFSGKVGIGTSDPGSLLSIGSPSVRGTVNIDGSNGDVPVITLTDSRSNGRVYSLYSGLSGAGNLNIFDQNAQAYRFTINSLGYVGIGTTNPGTYLEVKSSVNTGAPAFQLKNWNDVITHKIGASVSTGAGFLTLSTNSAVDNVFINSSGDSYLNGGRVGIGTTSPQSQLEIYNSTPGAATVRLHGSVTSGSSAIGAINFSNITDIAGGYIVGSISSLRNTYDNGGDLAFSTAIAAPVPTERMRITSGGNVGIGTTAPDSKLAVNGTIHTKEVKVDMNGWSDFVFEPSYKLRDLRETEQFIKENKHLPEIPSTAEVVKDGIKLGEINAKLLQKIEELTLYMIDMNKKMEAVQQKNDALEKKVATLENKL